MKHTILWLVFGLLVISNAVLALLLFTGDEDQSQAQSTPVELEEQTEVAGAVDGQPQVTAEEVVESDSSYDAQAANFSLDLSDSYQVIVEKDGGADSLRSTKLRIARSVSGSDSTVKAPADDYVKLEAYPSAINGTRDQFVTNDTALQGNFADEASSSVDGTQARRFTLEGAGKTIKYYFERDGNTYFIEAYDVSSGDTQLMLDDVVRGFSFN